MVHRIPAFGYVLKEPPQPLILDGEKARELGATGSQLARLKSGENVVLEDGTIVRSSDVTNPNRPSRTIAVMQDTRDASSAIPFMEGCDLLVHEATYESSKRDQAIEYGHSTSVMAAEIAKASKAKHLVLTHFSSRYGNRGDNDVLGREAEHVLETSRTRVTLAEDFMSIEGERFDQIHSALKPNRDNC
jgi:ribonuclease Z